MWCFYPEPGGIMQVVVVLTVDPFNGDGYLVHVKQIDVMVLLTKKDVMLTPRGWCKW